ncbi:MAG TPA: bifunctional glutamate N-acetyltransferase/amino-acid acetyltransferase ArgJ, partial [Chloroflexota bacterium]|nr:bifunctional glutamate N-acetyltransferase/amino-acid acetyltransferase ArgJ [Chloroflexota bacterium]
GVFTQNQLRAAPVRWCQQHLPARNARAIIANSGNANACTGEQGFRDAAEMASAVAQLVGLDPSQVLVGSTGVIGVPMPMERIREGIKDVRFGTKADSFAAAIMTTDARRKQASVAVAIGGREVRVGGVAKGAGMIHPNMATMLCFIISDAAVDPDLLPSMVQRAANHSFNMLTVDGDTSTNDTLLVLCNGAAANRSIEPASAEAERLEQAIEAVALDLARQMAADGEGASKSLEVRVTGAASEEDARMAARAVVASNLVKCAVYGNDPNWGRILCAIGNTSIRLDERRVGLGINAMQLVSGGVATDFDAEAVSSAMKRPLVIIDVDLGIGAARATALGCDMTPDYVTFNAEYTT